MRASILLLIAASALSVQAQTKCTDCALAPSAPSPLLRVPDFHMHYYDDGAADATVTCPNDCEGFPSPSPVPEVALLMKNPTITVPLLIECLTDGRRTNAQFDGNTTTYPMKVPVGYVCLDILMWRFNREPIATPDDCGDGLGACLQTKLYFRPDDYTHCVSATCDPRPWVSLVQKNWKLELRSGRIWRALRKQIPAAAQ